MIRQNSSSSLSKLMSEIDKQQDSDLEILKDFEEEEKGNTSVDSLMEDTPSNYNIANQRFDRAKYKKEPEAKYNEDEEYYEDESDYEEGEEDDEGDEEDDNDSITGPAGVPILNARQPKRKLVRRKKKKKRRRVKKPKPEFEDPTSSDIAMAKAYGGAPRGRPVRKYLKRKGSGRSTSSRVSRGFSKPARRDQFFNMGGAGSVSGRDPNQLRTLRSDNSKGGLGKTGLTTKKNRKRGPNSKVSNQDFDKVYDRKLDEFLENSSYEFESLGPPSRTMSRQGSVKGGQRLKGLESIYLQRLEANPAKTKKKRKRRGKKDGEFMGSELSSKDDLADLIEDNYKKMKKKFGPMSARKKNKHHSSDMNQPNIFTGNYTKYTKDHKLDKGDNI